MALIADLAIYTPIKSYRHATIHPFPAEREMFLMVRHILFYGEETEDPTGLESVLGPAHLSEMDSVNMAIDAIIILIVGAFLTWRRKLTEKHQKEYEGWHSVKS